MHCENCGKPVRPNSKFCNACGSQSGNDDAVYTPQRSQRPPQKKSSKTLTIVAIVAALVITAGVGVFLAWDRISDALPGQREASSNLDDDASAQYDSQPDVQDDSIGNNQDETDETNETGATTLAGGDNWSVVVEPTFTYITNFRDGMAAVLYGEWGSGQWGVIDTSGNFVLDLQFSALGATHQFYSTASEFPIEFLTARNDDKWGVIDIHGNVVIPFIYDDITLAENYDIAIVSVGTWEDDNRLVGIVNLRNGEEIVAPTFSTIDFPIDGIMQVRIGDWESGVAGFINTQGEEVVPIIYNRLHHPAHGIMAVGFGETWYDTLWGVVDMDGNEIIPAIHRDMIVLSPDLIAVQAGGWDTDTWGLLNSAGEEILPTAFGRINLSICGDFVNVTDGEWGTSTWRAALLYADTGVARVPFGQYNVINVVTDTLALVSTNIAGDFMPSGVINFITGEVIIPPGTYSQLFVHHDTEAPTLATVSVGHGAEQRTGVVDFTTGQVIVEPIFDQVLILSQDMMLVSVDATWVEEWEHWRAVGGLWGLLDGAGNELLAPQFTNFAGSANNLVAVGIGELDVESHTFDGYWGIVNASGELVVPVEYSFVSWWFDRDLALLNRGGTWPVGENVGIVGGSWGIVDETGQIIIPAEMEFDDFRPASENLVAVSRNRLWGVVSVDI